jgi:hypothetical protein
MATKKSLYEILEVPREASYGEIREAHQRVSQTLEGQKAIMSQQDYNLKSSVLRMAFDTLASPLTRDAYDAQLINREIQAKPGLALIPAEPSADAVKLKAEALMLKAEAMSLRADALGLKADAVAGGAGRGVSRSVAAMEPVMPSVGRSVGSTIKNLLLTLGALAALGMVLKVALLFWVTRNPDETALARKQAEEKVYLQEYYQAHGVRPASRAEADLLDAEERRKALAKSQKNDAADEQRMAADAEKTFQLEARRRAEQVSAELQVAEQRARQQRLEDEQRERYQQELDRRLAAETERKREAEQDKWRRILTTPSRY